MGSKWWAELLFHSKHKSTYHSNELNRFSMTLCSQIVLVAVKCHWLLNVKKCCIHYSRGSCRKGKNTSRKLSPKASEKWTKRTVLFRRGFSFPLDAIFSGIRLRANKIKRWVNAWVLLVKAHSWFWFRKIAINTLSAHELYYCAAYSNACACERLHSQTK